MILGFYYKTICEDTEHYITSNVLMIVICYKGNSQYQICQVFVVGYSCLSRVSCWHCGSILVSNTKDGRFKPFRLPVKKFSENSIMVVNGPMVMQSDCQ